MSPDEAIAVADQAVRALRLNSMWADDCRQEARIAAVRYRDRTIGQVYGVSESRVSQIRAQARRKLGDVA